eukprot:TRINITY_DN3019_c0_g1_i1.p1 TRINITY_DN3019_c0_g1~~TRINITY_DN3019_c0_g1_i1.p1  ORF type:complete len:111 (+),score=15.49 TRINITY_DN3019_c0_g1_i1:93-425(+)
MVRSTATVRHNGFRNVKGVGVQIYGQSGGLFENNEIVDCGMQPMAIVQKSSPSVVGNKFFMNVDSETPDPAKTLKNVITHGPDCAAAIHNNLYYVYCKPIGKCFIFKQQR